MKSKLTIEITLCRSEAKLVSSNIMSFDANDYAQIKILDLNQINVLTLNCVRIIRIELNSARITDSELVLLWND